MNMHWTALREVLGLLVFSALLFVGSLLVVTHLNGSYVPTTVWLIILAASTTLHIENYVLYSRQAHVVAVAEQNGELEDGSLLLAANQRLRYLIRMFEAFVAITIGVLGVIAISRPTIALHPSYGAIVLAYLYGSVCTTGFLSWRDLRVFRKIRALDAAAVERRRAERRKGERRRSTSE